LSHNKYFEVQSYSQSFKKIESYRCFRLLHSIFIFYLNIQNSVLKTRRNRNKKKIDNAAIAGVPINQWPWWVFPAIAGVR
jgi:hypothetical protein